MLAYYRLECIITLSFEVIQLCFSKPNRFRGYLEQLIIFVPSILLFARYFSPYLAAALGALYIIGRALYFRGYVKDPKKREAGFLLSMIPNVVLLIGGLIGALRALSVS